MYISVTHRTQNNSLSTATGRTDDSANPWVDGGVVRAPNGVLLWAPPKLIARLAANSPTLVRYRPTRVSEVSDESGFIVDAAVKNHGLSLRAVIGYTALRQATPDQPTKEYTDMTLEIKDQTLINGRDIKEYGDKELYTLLAREHKEIETLETLAIKPKKLLRQIAERKEQLGKLVELIDRDEP